MYNSKSNICNMTKKVKNTSGKGECWGGLQPLPRPCLVTLSWIVVLRYLEATFCKCLKCENYSIICLH